MFIHNRERAERGCVLLFGFFPLLLPVPHPSPPFAALSSNPGKLKVGEDSCEPRPISCLLLLL